MSSSHVAEYLRAKRSLLRDYESNGELMANERFSSYLNSFPPEKKECLLIKMFEQCYRIANKNIDKSKRMMRQIFINTSVVVSDEHNKMQVISPPKDEENLLTYQNKKILELFGESYFDEDNVVLLSLSDNINKNGDDWSSGNQTTDANNDNGNFKIKCNPTNDKIVKEDVFNSDDQINTDNTNVKINDEKPNIECTYHLLMEAELHVFEVINPADDIYKKEIINDLATNFSNGEFLLKSDTLCSNDEFRLIEELILKLFKEFNNTERNMAYLSGCLICVFREIVKKFPTCNIHDYFILFIGSIKKYAKQYDERFWMTWIVHKLFSDWCFIVACVFIKDKNLVVALKDKTILQNAIKYLGKIKHSNYELKRPQPVKGIFELSNKDSLLDFTNLSSSSKKSLLKSDINPITSESKIKRPELDNRIETMSQTKKYNNIEETCPVDLKTSQSVSSSSQKHPFETDINPKASETKYKKPKLGNHCVETISPAKKRKHIEEVCPVGLKTSQSVNGNLKLTESNNLLDIENLPSISDINVTTVKLNSKKPKSVDHHVETTVPAKKRKHIEEVCPVGLKTSQSVNGNLKLTESNSLLDIENLPSISDINVTTVKLNSKKPKSVDHHVETTVPLKKRKHIEEVCPVDLKTSQSEDGILEITGRNNRLDSLNMLSSQKNPSISDINITSSEISSKTRKSSNDFVETTEGAKKFKNIEEVRPVDLKTLGSVSDNLELTKSNSISDLIKYTSKYKNVSVSVIQYHTSKQEITSKAKENKSVKEECPVPSPPKSRMENTFNKKIVLPTCDETNQIKERPLITNTPSSKTKKVTNVKKTRHTNAINSQPSSTVNSQNSERPLITNTPSSKTKKVTNVKKTRHTNAINSQPSSIVNSQNSVSMTNQYWPVSNTQPYISPSFPTNTANYQQTHTIYNKPSSSMTNMNSFSRYNQYTPITQPPSYWNTHHLIFSNSSQNANVITTQPTNYVNYRPTYIPTYTAYNQPSNSMTTKNSVSMHSQYALVTNNQPSCYMNASPLPLPLPMNTVNHQPTNIAYTQPSSAMNSPNSVEKSTQYLAATNTLHNQPVSNGLQNSISNNDSIYNSTYQSNTYYNNFIDSSKINYSQYYNHASVPNTSTNSNHNYSSLSQQPYQYNQQSYYSNQQYPDPNSKNSQLRFNMPSTSNYIPNSPNQITLPAPRRLSVIQAPTNSDPPVVNSSRTVPVPRISSNHNNSNNQSKAVHFQAPNHNTLVSPDLPDAQSPSMPIRSTSRSNMCMAGNCTNRAIQNCQYCSVASYCSKKCQFYDLYYHKNECQKGSN